MNKIESYEQLISEKARIKNSIANKKKVICNKFDALKEEFEPLLYVMPLFGLLKNDKSKSNSFLQIGAAVAIDVIGQKVLRNAGWLTRFIVPFLLKRVSSNVMATDKEIKTQ